MTSESVSVPECEITARARYGRISAWRCDPSMVRFEAFLLSRGLLIGSAHAMCSRVNTVSKKVRGFDKLSDMDEMSDIPRLFPRVAPKYQRSLQSSVRWYQRFERVWEEGPSVLAEYLEKDLKGLNVNWREVPLLNDFHRFVIQSEHLDVYPASVLCQRIFLITHKAGYADFEILKVCDIDDFVGEFFKDKGSGYRTTTRRAIRCFQQFSRVTRP